MKCGVVGAGVIGRLRAQAIVKNAATTLVAVVDSDAASAGRAVAGTSAAALSDYRRLIDDLQVEAIFICTPVQLHEEMALAALAAGKHVFCEKPCATLFSDFRALIEAERANPQLITYVDYILWFDTMESRLRDMIESGEFGEISQVQVNYRHPVNITGDKVWKLNKSVMGDAIAMGINHAISVIVHSISCQARPVSVYATSRPAQVRDFEADPIWNILIRFDNGATGFCFGNIENSCGYDACHNIQGSDGGFVFDSQLDRPRKVRYWSVRSTGGKWVFPIDAERCNREGLPGLAWPAGTTTPDSGDVVTHQTGECVAHFIECVRSGMKSPLSFANSAVLGEIGWAAQMSAATGQAVPIPLDWSAASAFFEDSK